MKWPMNLWRQCTYVEEFTPKADLHARLPSRAGEGVHRLRERTGVNVNYHKSKSGIGVKSYRRGGG